MATAVLRSHDALANKMHLDAFAASPSKPRRRRHPKPSASVSPPPKMAAAVSSPVPKPAAAGSPPPKMPVASPVPKGPAAPVVGRRSPPARPARKQPSPTKEKPKQRMVMEEVRILKRGEEPPAPAPAPLPAPAPAVPARAQAPAASDKRALSTTSRIGPKKPAVVPTKIVAVAAASNAAGYAGPAFSGAAPEPSSLPIPAFFFRRAEEEATRGLRCLLRIGELS
ncbi:alpha carbonic anhydrase 8 [Brachypodium distachyon]|uniref:Uncharacterized protein n=1 Tax=Brachypodium distachyon TaxID=15368 RepID=A0A0Q3FSN8_BRADI|nr:alpha carbonic anhydrase 8 [Brachypodium distachyon]KQK01165.1 hypothetical protein BRADI_3g54210v3 [Brachypodium distachyon]|eukprot:XP_010235923.1 alpha carbonic anhydrase 8 [Brachypodium distachyon]